MQAKIEAELKHLPDSYVVLTIVPSDKFEDANEYLLKILTKYGKGTYITVNRPYKNIIELFKNKNINLKNLHFIDCITEELHEKEMGNCVFIDSPADLTDIAIALDNLFKKEDHEFIFLDSVDTLAVYNDTKRIIRFLHFLTGKIRMHKLKGIMISVHEKSDKELIAELSELCDKVIDLRNIK